MLTNMEALRRHLQENMWDELFHPLEESSGSVPICHCGVQKVVLRQNRYRPIYVCPDCWGSVDGHKF